MTKRLNLSLLINKERCVGCRICELACSFNHVQAFCPEQSKIQLFLTDDGDVEINVFCNAQCSGKEEAFCVSFCPTKALQYLND